MTMLGPNTDILMIIVFAVGFGIGVGVMVVSSILTGSPQPHCGVCVCP
jgi:hypothetical protein